MICHLLQEHFNTKKRIYSLSIREVLSTELQESPVGVMGVEP